MLFRFQLKLLLIEKILLPPHPRFIQSKQDESVGNL